MNAPLAMLRSGFLVVGGIAMLVTGPWIAVDNARFLEHSLRADGVVVDLDTQRARGMDLYRPVVRFVPAATGNAIEFIAKPGLWPSPYAPGDRVVVAYREVDPADAKVVSFWMLWFLPIVIALFGAGCLFAGWHSAPHRP